MLSALIENRSRILEIAKRHGIGTVRVFGSAARGDLRPDSDIDLLVEVTGKTSPWFPGGVIVELEQLLGRRIDVVEPDALRDGIRQNVLREAVPL